ncbi:hypothetical protein [Nonomuraea sediminis]|uniref:hypothetical protein n=1 Tax=Nonomuraea sediminis TaxID=2835864 RepID=UPI002029F239|nr:hypothetical protein [Nonomuraea sediminis]
MRTVKLLVGAYVALSVLTLAAIVLLRNNHTIVTDAAWVRATIVVLSSLLTLLFTRQAASGSQRGFLRLRIVSAAMLVAIAVIIWLPGLFPLWLRIEQGVCGLALLGVVILVNGRQLRAEFSQIH